MTLHSIVTGFRKRSDGIPVQAEVDDSGNLYVNLAATTAAPAALSAAAPAAATVGVTSAQAVASNTSRKGLILVNTSVNVISLGVGQAAVLNNGITLMPNGGAWEMDEYTFSTSAIFAIAAASSSNLAVQEFS